MVKTCIFCEFQRQFSGREPCLSCHNYSNFAPQDDAQDQDIGVKHDAGKRRWSLMPFDALEEVVEVLEFGADKYSQDNWTKIDDIQDRYFNAAMRHLIACRSGEKTDTESGKSHLAHVVCCLLFMILDEKQKPME